MGYVRNRELSFALRLKDARQDAGMRQVDVAEFLGKPQSFVAKIESGERRITFIETLDFCEAIGLDPKVLLTEFKR